MGQALKQDKDRGRSQQLQVSYYAPGRCAAAECSAAFEIFSRAVNTAVIGQARGRVHSDTKEYRKDKLSNYSSQVSHGPTDAIMT